MSQFWLVALYFVQACVPYQNMLEFSYLQPSDETPNVL